MAANIWKSKFFRVWKYPKNFLSIRIFFIFFINKHGNTDEHVWVRRPYFLTVILGSEKRVRTFRFHYARRFLRACLVFEILVTVNHFFFKMAPPLLKPLSFMWVSPPRTFIFWHHHIKLEKCYQWWSTTRFTSPFYFTYDIFLFKKWSHLKTVPIS